VAVRSGGTRAPSTTAGGSVGIGGAWADAGAASTTVESRSRDRVHVITILLIGT
jgi:hypothetical protein